MAVDVSSSTQGSAFSLRHNPLTDRLIGKHGDRLKLLGSFTSIGCRFGICMTREIEVLRILQSRTDGKWTITFAEGLDGVWAVMLTHDEKSHSVIVGFKPSRFGDAEDFYETLRPEDVYRRSLQLN